jgi:5-methylcytosine-specific restriction endonuclease McrA
LKTDRVLSDFWAWLDADRNATEEPHTPAEVPKSFVTAITGAARRTRPNAEIKTQILLKQHGRCLYCDHPFNTAVRRGRKEVILRLHWDHFVPYAYAYSNAKANWVAACHVCNGIKSCRVFDTVRQAKEFILTRWIEKGYEVRSELGFLRERS